MINEPRQKELKEKAQLIFYGIPIGLNGPSDSPVLGNKSLSQVVLNRCESVTKTPEEFKCLVGKVIELLRDTKGKEVSKIKLDQTTKSLVASGLTDQHGNLLKKW